MKKTLILFFLLVTVGLSAQENKVSGLNSKQFNKYWKVESESPKYKVTFIGDTVDIVSPKGLTLWRKSKMSGDVTIEYDACVVVKTPDDRLSDLNCFWMASDPKSPDNLWKREKWRNGVFANCYSLKLYYLGYGGNHNSTTRFRRYDGNEKGINEVAERPSIIKEYNDASHLLKANHWYKIKITSRNNRTSYFIDGKCIVEFNDSEPLKEGWFGFRTTLSHTRITNFRYEGKRNDYSSVPLTWIGGVPNKDKTVSFGVPFNKGELLSNGKLQLVSKDGKTFATDTWPLAYWPDGSIKWSAVASVIPAGTESLSLKKTNKISHGKQSKSLIKVEESVSKIKISTGIVTAFISRKGCSLIDSLFHGNVLVGKNARLVCTTQSEPILEQTNQVSFSNYISEVKNVIVERQGDVRALIRIEGVHKDATGRQWLPFVVRLYFYGGSREIKMVHSLIFDGDQNKDFIRSLGVRVDVPMREALYNRHVAFACADGGVWSEPVQPLVGRRVLSYNGSSDLQQQQMEGKRIPDYDKFDEKNKALIDNWASWDGYRLSQLSADAFSIRKRANDNNPWIGTFSGNRSSGYAFIGDITGGIGLGIRDFWQSYPSSIEINGTKSKTASMTAWLWSPDSEPMDLRHYDNVAHNLNASYEDVQDGLSTPFGVARTTSLIIVPQGGYAGKIDFAKQAEELSKIDVLLPSSQYLHDKQAFGVWSLPDRSTDFRASVEDKLNDYIYFYKKSVEQNKWYGFWNYGDFMHAYDPIRHSWRYDIGGFAWDNTELASNMWLWYSFLRTGDADIWRMAEAMSRHTCEVDVYHIGPNAGLGSRHNVSHWGCGAKEARISQAAWNRFYYYLTTDERSGDLMSEVKDADYKLYTLDPMRLAEPRSMYPCTAPARLRIGPDWLAYAGNWMTEWERTRNSAYRDKIIAGMNSIASLPNKLFTGPLALGYDPKTGIITSECDPKLQSTNHLMTIMGGFEIMNEMMTMINLPKWNEAWLDLAEHYKQKAWEIRKNRFRISRLLGYAAYHNHSSNLGEEAWNDMFLNKKRDNLATSPLKEVLPPQVPSPTLELEGVSTNDAATWSLDAIYLQEVVPMNDWK